MIGKKVQKVSPKKFKSGSKINTVKGVVMHPILKNLKAFTFEEDDSIVECRRCREVCDSSDIVADVDGPFVTIRRRTKDDIITD